MREDKIQLGVILEGEAKKRFEAIKNYYAVEKNADLIRVLITEKYEELKAQNKVLNRFEQINSDENGVKIHDRLLREVVTVYIKPTGVQCSHDQTDSCEHVTFALTLPEVKLQIRKHRKEGWNLPDI